MDIRILGPLEVVADGRLLSVGGAQRRAVLALLATRAPEPVSIESLIDGLWGERPPSTARHALQVQVSGIRKVFERAGADPGACVRSTGLGYSLSIAPDCIDARRFERLVAEGRAAGAADPQAARELFARSLGEWRGTPFEEFPESRLLMLESERLLELHTGAVEGLLEARLELGESEEVLTELTALVNGDPLRERPRRLLMLALYRSGRHVEALTSYREACAALDEIGLQPGPKLRALETAILRHDPSLEAPTSLETPERAASGRARPSRIPPRGAELIGRGAALDELDALLADLQVGLLTVTGPGGIGKTTVALEAARRAAPRYADGVDVVWLATVGEEQVVSEVARVLGIGLSPNEPAIETIASALRHQHRLLLLDNFEHVLGAAGSVAALVAACPSLMVLVTSRAPLRVSLERPYPLAALDTPDATERPNVAAVRRSAAGALFIERAAAAQPGFVLTDREAPAVGELCRYLGGNPLAVELAAARVSVLSPPEILERVRSSLDSLGPGRRDAPERQRTLRAAIAWSVELLDAREQELFARLSLFQDGFTLDGAEAVSSDLELSVVDGLALLLDHGLIHRVSARRGTRMGMLEPVREYAAERLRGLPHSQKAAQRCAEYYAEFAAQADRGFDGGEQLLWIDRLDDEQANLRAILRHADTRALRAAAMSVAVNVSGQYWGMRGLTSEIMAWLERALAEPGGDPVLRARALLSFAIKAGNSGEHDRALEALAESLTLARRLRMLDLESCCESTLGWTLGWIGRSEEAAFHHDRAIALATEGDNPWTLALVLARRGTTGHFDYETKAELLGRAIELFERLGDRADAITVRSNLGYLALLAGDYEVSRRALERSAADHDEVWGRGTLSPVIEVNLGLLDLFEERWRDAHEHLGSAAVSLLRGGLREQAREALNGLAALAASEGHPDRAARLAVTARTLYDGPHSPAEKQLFERYLGELGADSRESTGGQPQVSAAELDAILREIPQEAAGS